MSLEKGGKDISTPKVETPGAGKDTKPEMQKKEGVNLDKKAIIGEEKPGVDEKKAKPQELEKNTSNEPMAKAKGTPLNLDLKKQPIEGSKDNGEQNRNMGKENPVKPKETPFNLTLQKPPIKNGEKGSMVTDGNAGKGKPDGNADNSNPDGNTVNDGNNADDRACKVNPAKEVLKQKIIQPAIQGLKAVSNAAGIMTNASVGNFAGVANNIGKLYNNLQEYNPEPRENNWTDGEKQKLSDKVKPYFDAFGDGQKYVDQQEKNGGKKRTSFEGLMEASLYAAGGEERVQKELTPGKRKILRGLANLMNKY